MTFLARVRRKNSLVAVTPKVMLYGRANGSGDVTVQIRKKGKDCYKVLIFGEHFSVLEEVIDQQAIIKAIETKRLKTPRGAVITLTSLVAIRKILAA